MDDLQKKIQAYALYGAGASLIGLGFLALLVTNPVVSIIGGIALVGFALLKPDNKE